MLWVAVLCSFLKGAMHFAYHNNQVLHFLTVELTKFISEVGKDQSILPVKLMAKWVDESNEKNASKICEVGHEDIALERSYDNILSEILA